MSLVTAEADGPVRTITLNAPDKLNALNWPLLHEFKAAVEDIARDDAAGVLVVAGAGRAFCAGADLGSLFGDRTRSVKVLKDVLLDVYGSFLGVRDLAIPTVAAVHGPAVGAGMNIALACDVIVAGPEATFAPSFSRIGLHPGGGCSWLLTQRVGAANALAALYSGDTIAAERAFSLGIAQELTTGDPRDRANVLAHEYASHDAALMADIKQSVRIASSDDLGTSLEAEATAQARSLKSEAFERFAERFR
jgi:enoyl-CoA hydratase